MPPPFLESRVSLDGTVSDRGAAAENWVSARVGTRRPDRAGSTRSRPNNPGAQSRASAAIIPGAPAGGPCEYQPLSAVTRLPSAEWLLRYLLELDQNLAARVVATSAAVRDFSLGSRVLWCVGRTNCRGLSKTPLPVERGQWSADLRSAWPRPEQFLLAPEELAWTGRHLPPIELS